MAVEPHVGVLYDILPYNSTKLQNTNKRLWIPTADGLDEKIMK